MPWTGVLYNWASVHVTLRTQPSARIAYATAAASLPSPYSKWRDPVDLAENLRLRRELRQALRHLST